jgi:hypothetical protein
MPGYGYRSHSLQEKGISLMNDRTTIILFVSFIVLHVFLLGKTDIESKTLPSDAGGWFVLPSPVLKITSFEFKGIVSDLLFIKAMVFMGSTYERNEEPRLKPEKWQWLDKVLTASTDLDPYFIDPYYLANAHLTWDGGLVRETNLLLEKGIRYRDWDWILPFYAGFNSFFFLHDSAKAADFLVIASKRPGPSEQLLSLASRLAYKDKKTENAILFLEAVEKKTENERLKNEYQTRVHALQVRLFLERSLLIYKEKFRRVPVSLQRMIEKGILKEIPRDPYGGKFSISPDGEITCTSDYLLMPGQR